MGAPGLGASSLAALPRAGLSAIVASPLESSGSKHSMAARAENLSRHRFWSERASRSAGSSELVAALMMRERSRASGLAHDLDQLVGAVDGVSVQGVEDLAHVRGPSGRSGRTRLRS